MRRCHTLIILSLVAVPPDRSAFQDKSPATHPVKQSAPDEVADSMARFVGMVGGERRLTFGTEGRGGTRCG